MRKCEQNWINGTNCKTSQGDDDDDDGYCQLAAVAATSDHCSKFTIANWRACALCNVHKCENVEHECRVAKSHIVADEGGNEGMHRGGKYRHMKNWQSEQNRYVIACRCIESSISMHGLATVHWIYMSSIRWCRLSICRRDYNFLLINAKCRSPPQSSHIRADRYSALRL